MFVEYVSEDFFFGIWDFVYFFVDLIFEGVFDFGEGVLNWLLL